MYSLFMEGEAHDRVHRICAELELSPPLLKAFIHLGTVDEQGEFKALGGLGSSELAGGPRCLPPQSTSRPRASRRPR